MEDINDLYQQYVSCGGNLSLEEIYESCTTSIRNEPEKWQSKDLDEAVKNLLSALVYIRCTPYSKIMELAEESFNERSKKYLTLIQENPSYLLKAILERKLHN
jgi:hypothetical protein